MKPSAILTYHSLDDSGSVISTPPRIFRDQMEHLRRSGVEVVRLEEVALRPGAVAIAFDDAFRSFHTSALPVLRDLRIPATLFVVSGYCGRKNDWPSQAAGVQLADLMNWTELCDAVSQGMDLGAHTVTHPHLPRIDPAEAESELRQSRMEIEHRTGARVTAFAYPYGEWNPALRAAAACHFKVACTTELRFVEDGADPLLLPRLDTYYLRARLFFENLANPAGRGYLLARHYMRGLKRKFAY
jgi:peptidoglycan/xylan/chitin deacetylase (PgdA/CDA1 family)